MVVDIAVQIVFQPLPETVALVEDIVVEYITDLVRHFFYLFFSSFCDFKYISGRKANVRQMEQGRITSCIGIKLQKGLNSCH